MPAYKLVYFNMKGRAESTRFLFVISGVDYEDKRIAGEEWAKLKADLSLGQIPVLYVDGKVLPQSRAISRYVAGEVGLYGSNAWEQALIDVVTETIDEISPGVGRVFTEQDEAKKNEARKKFFDEEFSKTAAKLELLLKQNNNGTGWFVGDKVSLADVVFYAVFVDFLPAIHKCTDYDFKGLDALKGLVSRFESQPKVAEWIKNRPKSDM